MAKRKTVTVESIRAQINDSLSSDQEDSELFNVASRLALAMLLEKVLMDSGNYKGFRYVYPEGHVMGRTFDESKRWYF